MSVSIRIRQIVPGDEKPLRAFYNGLSEATSRLFHPWAGRATIRQCKAVIRGNASNPATQFDLLAVDAGNAIVGWGFLWGLESSAPMFGMAVADDHQGRGLGRRLMRRVMREAARRQLPEVTLTVVRDNTRAIRLYESEGFQRKDFITGSDGLEYIYMTARISTSNRRKTAKC